MDERKADVLGQIHLKPGPGRGGGAGGGEKLELKMLDLGAAYKVAQEVDVACFRCYCGSGCLCGCVN